MTEDVLQRLPTQRASEIEQLLLDQAGDLGRTLSSGQHAGGQPVLAAGRHCTFVLPIAGKKLKSSITGMPCTGAA